MKSILCSSCKKQEKLRKVNIFAQKPKNYEKPGCDGTVFKHCIALYVGGNFYEQMEPCSPKSAIFLKTQFGIIQLNDAFRSFFQSLYIGLRSKTKALFGKKYHRFVSEHNLFRYRAENGDYFVGEKRP